jgi:hypothetical protein
MQQGGGGIEAACLVSVVFAEGAAFPATLATCPSASYPIEPILPYLLLSLLLLNCRHYAAQKMRQQRCCHPKQTSQKARCQRLCQPAYTR